LASMASAFLKHSDRCPSTSRLSGWSQNSATSFRNLKRNDWPFLGAASETERHREAALAALEGARYSGDTEREKTLDQLEGGDLRSRIAGTDVRQKRRNWVMVNRF
jgi:hypothetical protein